VTTTTRMGTRSGWGQEVVWEQEVHVIGWV